MALTSSLAFVVLLLCLSFCVNPLPYNNPTASAPASWTNSPSLTNKFTFKGGETVRSVLPWLNASGMSFATGFYCFPPCKSFFLSIYIVYIYYHDSGYGYDYSPQVIWLATRARPVSENTKLQLTSQYGLTLRDNDGGLVWSTNVVNRSVAGINITEAGNLVLFDINNSIIWQSFDYPTDCLVMGQKLAGGMRIIANSSSTNLAESQFYLTLLADSLYGFVGSDPPLVYYYSSTSGGPQYNDTSNKTVDKSNFIKFTEGGLSMFSTLSNNYTPPFFTFPPGKLIQYMRLESDGHLRLYAFDKYSGWIMVSDLFDMDKCDYPTVCEHYGICTTITEECICPAENLGNYFKPVNDRPPEFGCYAITNITCQDVNKHLLLDLKNVSYFNIVDNVAFNATDEETCKKACLGDCRCKGALFQTSDWNSSVGKCLILPEVFSLKDYQPDVAQFNSSVYIKVQASSSKVGLGAILGSTFGALLFMLALIISIYIVCLRRREEAQDEDIIEQLPGMPTRFTFEELRAATENFVKKLGEGGFGTVFEGRWGDERIAVKRLDNVTHGKKDFLAEVETIGSIHHINLVRMIGFCADKLNRLLVYEYMCNGSLDQWIYCRDRRVPLEWPIRFKIITDIAKGLCYLHEECRQKIVHFDIKPANILLDENFNAKVSDFGLSKLIDRDISRVMTNMRGTPGYLAPEWLTAMVTEKVDVYGFGVVVIEILSGRRNLDDSQTEENHHLIKLLEKKSKSNGLSDLIDKNLGDVELYKKEIVNVMELAMWCLQWDSTRRPSMLMVVEVLKGAMEVETSLDYNFVSSIPTIANIPGLVDQSTPLFDSMLSGPR